MTAVKSKLPLFLGLLALMVVTRTHHFGTVLTLPDATLAVFFLMGLVSGTPFAPLALLAAAGASDLYVMGSGESGWCVTPAYAALIPAYLTLWAAGRWTTRQDSLMRTGLALVAGVSGFFLISNTAFYLFSGYFAEMSVTRFMSGTMGYFLPYLAVAALYTGSLLVVARVMTTWQGEKAPALS